MDHLIIKVGPTETEAVKMFENFKTSIYQRYKSVGKKIELKIFKCGLKLSLSQGGDRGTPKCTDKNMSKNSHFLRICLKLSLSQNHV